jgi:nucleotide-binding universal stress UspA family protein
MFNLILVPLDGSLLSEQALPLASTLARIGNARLVLVRAANVTGPLGGSLTESQRHGIDEEDLNLTADLWGAERPDAEARAVEEADAYLARVSVPLIASGLVVDLASPFGPAADRILDEINLRHADLVIMSTHGRSGLGRWLYGSVAEGVLAHSPVPVLLVRPRTPEAATLPVTAVTHGARLLVPLDGSALSEAALPHAATLARTLGGPITLLYVASMPILPYTDLRAIQDGQEEIMSHMLAQEQARAQRYLDEVATRLQHDGLQAQTVVCVGMPADAIHEQAQALDARVIVMATLGSTGLRRFLMGSVAMQVVRESQLPVLLVRPPMIAGAATETTATHVNA